jgi:hypothetical protein
MYIDIARTAVVKKVGLNLTGEMDPLWLDAKGNKEKNISRLVLGFFRETANLHITTTTLRALIEMQAHAMYKQGEISLTERESISNSNGHCLSSTVEVRSENSKI